MALSPSTNTINLTVQKPDGSGNPAYSYALAINSTNCRSLTGNDNCSYTVQLPTGADVVNLLATKAANVPLDYSQPIPFTVTANGPNTLNLPPSPIIASAVPVYAFRQFNGSNPSYPLVALSRVADAAGDVIASAATFPQGYPYSQINISQTAGAFDFIAALDSGGGSYELQAGPIAGGASTKFALDEHGGYAVELGNGTTSAFTAIVLSGSRSIKLVPLM